MKRFFRKHPETLLIILAFLFLALLISYYVWGVGMVIEEVNRAVSTKGSGGDIPSFNLDAAAKLDWRGLVSQ